MRLPWRREPTEQTGLPQEVQDYYQAEQRERVGVASLLAVGTLVLTVLLATGIFFGGRWVWRHTADRNKNKGTTTATVRAPDDQGSSSTSTPSSSPSSSSQSATTGTSGSSAAGSTGNNSSSGSSSPTSTTPSTPSSSTGTSTTPSSTSTSHSLANTGPSSVLPFALGAMALGFIVAEWYQRRPVKR